MDVTSPDIKEPKQISRRRFIKGLAAAATVTGTASTVAQLSREETSQPVPPPYQEPTSRSEIKLAPLSTEDSIFKNFSPFEKAAIEKKIAQQKEDYKKANGPLRAERVLNWEETTLKPIFDSDKVPERKRQFWSEFLSAIVYVESEGKHYLKSKAGAIGLTQLTEATAKTTATKHEIFSFNLERGWDNLRLGRLHLQDLMERFGVDITVLAYYAGFTFANDKVLAALANKGVNATRATDHQLLSYIDQYKINIANLGSKDGQEYLKKVVAALRILDQRRTTPQTIT